MLFRAWRALAAGRAGETAAFRSALARWVLAVAFWEKRLCRACLEGWAAWVASLRLAAEACVELRAHSALRRHWSAYRVCFNERRLGAHTRPNPNPLTLTLITGPNPNPHPHPHLHPHSPSP
mgnify:CR=1 FL=1